MEPKLKNEPEPSEEVFDEIDLEAIPAIREGLADLRAGRVHPSEEVFAEVREHIRAMR